MSLSLSSGNNWSYKLSTAPIDCISHKTSQAAISKEKGKGLHEKKAIEFDTPDNDLKNDFEKRRNTKYHPLINALKASANENAASFHFPGHNRGQAAPSSLTNLIGQSPFMHDLPELPELDNLFSPEGPILEAQKQAADLFGASETWFLVGGSTCGIQAAIMAACSPGETLVLPRNCHISAISAMVLSGVIPKYILPEYDSILAMYEVEEAIYDLQKENRKPAAVLIVSPSYHGICSDIAAISKLCHDKKIPLIVDEAHGAHFGFHTCLPTSALAQGADIVIQSTHKVLSSLTQSSMLHLSGKLVDREKICRSLQMLQSSSPSYLLLASLDAATAQLSGDNRETIFGRAIELALEAKTMISKIPKISLFKCRHMDPLRVTVGVQDLGLSGFEADDILFKDFKVIPELVGTRSITLAFNLGTKREHVSRLISGLEHLSATFGGLAGKASDDTNIAVFNDINMVLSPRDAFFVRKRKVGLDECLGKICGELICPYPPGIPVLVPGEVITESALGYLLSVKRMGAVITGAVDPSLLSLVVCEVSENFTAVRQRVIT
ncbi:arginine decarboxylase [Striga asiatica]|uniref:Arginine decarboxylase n=1 Tax=Striga asiatica TaxID=4170 RepID=A0A5A7PTG7_STRAF|nr:arginine decarboxylase [Striga asiatica]